MKSFSSIAGIFIAALVLAGCASVKVDPATVHVNATLKKPAVIYVHEFNTSGGSWEVPQSVLANTDLATLKAQAAHDLAQALLKELGKIAPAQQMAFPFPASGLLVTGEFVNVNPGNRTLRMGVGLGAGATHVKTLVWIYDLAVSTTVPVATFVTRGGSGSEPGFVIGGATSTISGMSGLTADWGRTAKQVREFLEKRMLD